jgi:hypothetical protein
VEKEKAQSGISAAAAKKKRVARKRKTRNRMSNHRGKEKNSRLRVRPAIAHTTRRRLTKTNFNMGDWGGQQQGGGGGGNVRPGDWQCPAGCGNVFASKMNCFKCGQPRPENAEVASGEQVRRASEGHGHQEPRSANPRNSFLTC